MFLYFFFSQKISSNLLFHAPLFGSPSAGCVVLYWLIYCNIKQEVESLLSGQDNFKEGWSNLAFWFSSSVILEEEEGATFGGVLFEIILVTFGAIVVEVVVVLVGTREVDLVLLLSLFLSLNFFPFTIVTLAVVGIGLGVVVVVDLVLPVWVGTIGWAKSQAPFFSWKKLYMLDPIFCFQRVLGAPI